MSDNLKIIDSMKNIEYWLNQPYVSSELSDSIQKADLVLVPWEYEPNNVYVFPTGTIEFTQYLQKKLQDEQLTLEICIQEADYQEIALHSEVLRIVEIIVTLAIAPIVTGIIANYIFDTLGKRRAKKATVESSLTIRTSEKSKSVKLDYSGPAETYEKIMLEAIDKLSVDTPPTNVEDDSTSE
jgi:hypothetical protein